jgi:hypothetical protein
MFFSGIFRAKVGVYGAKALCLIKNYPKTPYHHILVVESDKVFG